MKLAERHRLNPRKKKEKEKESEKGTSPSSVKLRRKGSTENTAVLYLNKSVYADSASSSDESAESFLKRINDEYSLNMENDADLLLAEIFKRGWKVRHIELSIGRMYLIRFFRDVGGDKSRAIHKKDKSIKKLLLRALEHILQEESGRYSLRMRRQQRSRKDLDKE